MVLRISFNDDVMIRFIHDEPEHEPQTDHLQDIKSVLKPSPSSKKELGGSPESECRTITFNVGNRYHGFEMQECRNSLLSSVRSMKYISMQR